MGKWCKTAIPLAPEASQHAQTQTCIPWPGAPDEDPDEGDVHAMFTNMKQGARHKALVIFKHEITPDILCKKLLIPRNLPTVRRVLIFVDSKDIATKIVRLMHRDSFMNSWGATKHKVTVTPYHAGVAPSSRKLCEEKMAKFVKLPANDSASKQVHFIIATSALEAGVNIKGIDAIVILSALACNRRSLIQRYGRGGREKDKPTVIMIGYASEGQSAAGNVDADDADEDINMSEDSHASEGQSAAPVSVETGNDDEDINTPEDSPDFIRQPERFLLLNDAPFSVCKTRAMRIHGACQFLSALIRFKREFAPRDVQESVINLMKPDQGRVRFGELDHPNPKAWICELMTELKTQLVGELPISGEAMSMRAISGRTLKLHEAAGELPHIHRYNTPCIRLGNNRYYKDLGRVSETMLFRNLHWNAQFYTPHGRLVRVISYDIDRKGDNHWNKRIRGVIVQGVPRGQMPYVTLGDSHEHVQFSLDLNRDPDHEANGSEVEVGEVVVKTTWLGFSYRNPYDVRRKIPVGEVGENLELHLYLKWPIRISAVPQNTTVANDLLGVWEFFKPAESSKNGWRWNISKNFPSATDPLRSLVLRALCAELRLRLSYKLHFNPSQITICLLSRKLQKCILEAEKQIQKDWSTNTNSISNKLLDEQDDEAWQQDQSARLILFEHSNAGIAIECLRVLLPTSDAPGRSLLDAVDKLELDDQSRRKSLRDFKVMETWENPDSQEKLRERVIECLTWLKEAAHDVRQREKWR